MKNKIFLLLSLVFVALGLSAQSLVFHLPDGGLSTVGLPATFTISPSGDKLIIESGGTRVELDKNRILAMTYRSKKGDVNDDMQVDVADIATIIDIMAGKGGDTEPEKKVYTSCPDGNHPHIIDLGLPSGTKWACCNVGASKPEDYGSYYAWGETKTKEVYNWDTNQYGYNNDDGDYSHLVNIGSDIAGTEYDAATANWKAPWRMPTIDQCRELLDNCTSEWTTQNDVNGRTQRRYYIPPRRRLPLVFGSRQRGLGRPLLVVDALRERPVQRVVPLLLFGRRGHGPLQPRPRSHGAPCSLEMLVHPFPTRKPPARHCSPPPV